MFGYNVVDCAWSAKYHGRSFRCRLWGGSERRVPAGMFSRRFSFCGGLVIAVTTGSARCAGEVFLSATNAEGHILLRMRVDRPPVLTTDSCHICTR